MRLRIPWWSPDPKAPRRWTDLVLRAADELPRRACGIPDRKFVRQRRGNRHRTSSGGTATATAGNSLAVVGTVSKIKANTIIVTDLGGTKHTVRMTSKTTVTKSYRISANPLAVGATISVTGDTADNGSVTASSVNVR